MGMCIAVVSQKGGVGKTTLAANLAAAFADLRFRTLLVEVDPQGSLVRTFGLDRFDLHNGLYGCIVGHTPPAAAIDRGLLDQLDFLPANVWSHEEEIAYVSQLRQDPAAIRNVVRELEADYDYVILDGPPALGPLTRGTLAAADRYLVPVQAEAMNLASLGRLEHLAGEVRTHHNPELRLDGYVVTMADLRTRHAVDVIQTMTRDHPRDLFQTIIPRSIRVADEAVRGRPTVMFAGSSRAGRALQALAEEILSRHSRERAAARAGADDEPGAPDDVAAWERVLAELPDDEPPSVPSSGNGSGRWEDH